jgi:hypothetical protein
MINRGGQCSIALIVLQVPSDTLLPFGTCDQTRSLVLEGPFGPNHFVVCSSGIRLAREMEGATLPVTSLSLVAA